ncbi:MAG: hypothetical protein ACREGR_01630 [Minisyncoccia bacterium]
MGEFKIAFDVVKGGEVFSRYSVRDVGEEDEVLGNLTRLYGDKVRQTNRKVLGKPQERSEASVNDHPALRALRLVNVYCDGSYDLVSLTLGCVIASGGQCDLSVPTIELNDEVEVAIAQAAGKEWDGFPGWEAVVEYLKVKGVA